MADAYTGIGRNKWVAKKTPKQTPKKQVATILPVKAKKTPKTK